MSIDAPSCLDLLNECVGLLGWSVTMHKSLTFSPNVNPLCSSADLSPKLLCCKNQDLLDEYILQSWICYIPKPDVDWRICWIPLKMLICLRYIIMQIIKIPVQCNARHTILLIKSGRSSIFSCVSPRQGGNTCGGSYKRVMDRTHRDDIVVFDFLETY